MSEDSRTLIEYGRPIYVTGEIFDANGDELIAGEWIEVIPRTTNGDELTLEIEGVTR